jgi:hypothetical protein
MIGVATATVGYCMPSTIAYHARQARHGQGVYALCTAKNRAHATTRRAAWAWPWSMRTDGGHMQCCVMRTGHGIAGG